MGRPRKPTASHERDGTLREDRHGARRREPQFAGEPIKPKGMAREAQEHWDFIVPRIVKSGVLKETDTCTLQMMCEMWAEYRAAKRLRPKGIDDKRKRLMMVNSARKAWLEHAKDCGLTPIDRARLEVEAGGDSTNPLDQMLTDQPTLNVVG